ncbi:acyltransferase [Shewanella oncorhynchi]|uniref:acyltransferase n=1 Tax=Shewanella oncorhynchi TaxID=2726434 RepID=UPI003D796F76
MLWLHNLRFISVFAVIVLHSAAAFYSPNFLDEQLQNDFNFLGGIFFNSATRWCVPVFVTVSGFLLLDKDDEIIFFYKKRLNRLFFPFLFWSLFFTIFLYFKLVVKSQPERFLMDVLNNLLNGYAYYHLWYLSMIPFLYLITPFLRVFLDTLSKFQFLSLTFFCVFMSLINFLWNSFLFDDLSGSFFGVLFVQYIGYFMLGGFFSKYCVKLGCAKLLFMLTISLLVTFFGVCYLSPEYFYGYLSLNVCVSAICIFLLFRLWQPLNSDFFGMSVKLSALSFGVYLLHPFYLEVFHYIFKSEVVNFGTSFLYIPASSLFTFLFSCVTIHLFSKNHILSKLI